MVENYARENELDWQAIVAHTLQQYNLATNTTIAKKLTHNTTQLAQLMGSLYSGSNHYKQHAQALITTIVQAHVLRSNSLLQRDAAKPNNWYTSNQLVGMSLYVDKFCGTLPKLPSKLPYLQQLGVNLLHLMPLMQSPTSESDGGYAVSNFKEVDKKFGTLTHLIKVKESLHKQGMYLMLDIVLNHTSHHHQWAINAKAGDTTYQNYYHTYHTDEVPKQYNQHMPDIFPESSPGNFTYNPQMQKWVMTVFHNYQWDLNFSNPAVFIAMLDTIYFYANLGVDVLRIDAPAFIWKQLGTTCQNLPQAHTILQLIKLCVSIATPGMALLGEAIVAPTEILKYFGTGTYKGKECDIAYGATNMALQWDALATGDTRVMLAAQAQLQQKPQGTTWISYTRCHDDIGLGYDDDMISQAGYNPYEHRNYIKNYYSGNHPYSTATGALFSINPVTNDARISGTLASLCGLEKAIIENDTSATQIAINKITLLQAQSLLIGGIPMLYYGDEVGYTNDYTYLTNPAKSYDNRWLHRPIINWNKNELHTNPLTVEAIIFANTQKIIAIRKQLPVISDSNNIDWLQPHNIHVAGFLRYSASQNLFCLFNYSNANAYLVWQAFTQKIKEVKHLYCHLTKQAITVGNPDDFYILQPYGVAILEVINEK